MLYFLAMVGAGFVGAWIDRRYLRLHERWRERRG